MSKATNKKSVIAVKGRKHTRRTLKAAAAFPGKHIKGRKHTRRTLKAAAAFPN